MSRYVAFLRGINVGGHRVKNDQLCAQFEAMGFIDVAGFLASGNVIFEAADAAGATGRIEEGLKEALGYEVPTFLRTAEEVRSIAEREIFAGELDGSIGKPQVAFLTREPEDAVRSEVLGLASEDDRLAIHDRELYWLPRLGFSKTELDLAAIDAVLGPMTVRTKRTVERIAAKYLTPS